MSRPFRLAVLFACFLTAGGCSTTRVVAPLERGESRVGASLGGPLTNKTVGLPIPFSSLYYARGVTRRVTAFGGLHTTSLLFLSVQSDLGVAVGVTRPAGARPGLSVSTVLNTFYGIRGGDIRVFPEIAPSAYWRDATGTTYVGLTSWFDPWHSRSSSDNTKPWIPSLNLGREFRSGGPWSVTLELRYLGLNVEPIRVEELRTIGPGSHGGFAFYVSTGRNL